MRGRPPSPWILVALAAAVAFFNACPNVLVFDDRALLSGNPFAGLGPAEFMDFFRQSVWEVGGNERNQLYRPLFMLVLGLEGKLFGQWFAGYHLVNLLLHVLASVLVFGFVRALFRAFGYAERSGQWAPLMATLVYAVHPVMTDAVNSIFNGSDLYVTIAFAGGLWYLLSHHREHPLKAWSLLSLVYLGALLFKESAVALPALAVLTVWMGSGETWRKRVLRCLPVLVLLLPLAVYLGMREHALGSFDDLATGPAATVLEVSPDAAGPGAAGAATGEAAGGLSFGFEAGNLLRAVGLWYDSLEIMVWPRPLMVLRKPSQTPFWPAFLVQLGLFSLAVYAFYRNRPAALFGLLFFYAAILPVSRIVAEGTIKPVLIERMLHTPSVGLVLVLAAALAWFAGRTSVRTAVIAAAILVLALMPQTWARNQDWSNEIGLLEGDYAKTDHPESQLVYSMVRVHLKAGNTTRAIVLCGKHSRMARQRAALGIECAHAYTAVGRLQQAESVYLQLLERRQRMSNLHFHLGRLYVLMDRWRDARNHYQRAVVEETVPFLREFMQGYMLMDLYPHDPVRLAEAREHLENALRLQPRARMAREALATLPEGPP